MRTPRFATGAVIALLLVIYGIALGRMLVPADFNPLALARLSREFPAERFWDQAPVFEAGIGYDGQFFYYLARDPLLLGGSSTHLDAPAYRYQRILLPVLAYVFAFGQAPLIGWTLLLTNLLALGLGCWYAARLLDSLGASRWWLLPYALNPGYLMGVQLDLSEPLALALATAGCYYYLRGRHGLAGAMLAVGVLARETVLVVGLGIALYEILSHRAVRRALPYLVPTVTWAAWQAVVFWRVGELAFGNGSAHLSLPFVGVVRRLGFLQEMAQQATGIGAVLQVTGEALSVVAMVFAAVLAFDGVRRRSALGWQLAMQGLFVLMLNARVWDVSLNFARAAALLYLAYLLVVVETRSRTRQAAPGRPGNLIGEPPRLELDRRETTHEKAAGNASLMHGPDAACAATSRG